MTMMTKLLTPFLLGIFLFSSLSKAESVVISRQILPINPRSLTGKNFHSLDEINKLLALAEHKRREMELCSEVKNAYIELYVLQKGLQALNELMQKRRTALKENSSAQEKIAFYKDANEYDNFAFKTQQAQYKLNNLMNASLTVERTLENPIKIINLPDKETLTHQAIQHWLALDDLIQKQKVFLPQKPPGNQSRAENTSIVMPLKKGTVLDKAAFQNEIALDVARAYEQYLSFGKIVIRDQESLLPLAEQAIRHEPPVLSFKEYTDIQLNYLQAALTYQEALSDLEMLIGSPLQ